MRVVKQVIRQGDAEAEVCSASLATPGPPDPDDLAFQAWDRAMRILANLPPPRS